MPGKVSRTKNPQLGGLMCPRGEPNTTTLLNDTVSNCLLPMYLSIPTDDCSFQASSEKLLSVQLLMQKLTTGQNAARKCLRGAQP